MAAKDDRSASGTPGAWKILKETVILLVSAVLIALVVKTFVVQSFYIPSQSMEPGLEVNDRILVQKPSYWFDGPQRGDVVVFEDPGGWLGEGAQVEPRSALTRTMATIGLYPTGGHLVKRVIGVEGDVIRCCDDQGRLMVNAEPVDEAAYVNRPERCAGPMVTRCQRDWKAGPIPSGMLFVMGDNRPSSEDSSVHVCFGTDRCDPGKSGTEQSTDGYVPVGNVVGKVFALAWPPDRAELVHRPKAFDTVPATSD